MLIALLTKSGNAKIPSNPFYERGARGILAIVKFIVYIITLSLLFDVFLTSGGERLTY